MYSVIASVILFTLIVLCALYTIKEMIRRKKRPKEFLEANDDIRVSILCWSMGVITAIGYTIAYYTIWFKDYSFKDYIIMCLISLVYIIVAFIWAIKKLSSIQKPET